VQAIDAQRIMLTLRGHLSGDESIVTFTKSCADFHDPTALFRVNS
jgi:hypothetical protein